MSFLLISGFSEKKLMLNNITNTKSSLIVYSYLSWRAPNRSSREINEAMVTKCSVKCLAKIEL
jgi:hypothetical protein